MTNATTFIGFAITFIQSIAALGLFFYWPVYFQAGKGVGTVKCVYALVAFL